MRGGPEMDPVTFEVIKHRLWQINDEQGLAIKTISASPIVVEGNDYNVGLFTADAELVTAGIGSLVHVTTMGDAVASIMQNASEIRDGDAFLTNDPFLGALHQNDVVLAAPIFRGGRIFMWAANVLHHADVGGIDAGSFCINARTIFEDPPRFFMKIVDRGVPVAEAEHTMLANSRLPESVAIDLRAQIGALNVAGERLRRLLDERGDELVRAVMDRSIDIAERQVRDLLRALPDGSWTGAAFMDGVRVGDDRVCRVAVTLSSEGDSLHFDYTGSSEQVDAAVNCTASATFAGSAVPLYSFLCQGGIDWNDGLKRCMRVTAPEGTVVNARHPAPVSISTVGFRWLATVAAAQAVARMFASSEAFRDRACPSWNVSSNCNNIFAVRADGSRIGAMLSDHRGSGAAGRSFGDGFDHAGTITSYASSIGNVEGTEWKLPVRYLYRRRLADSGGAGEFRGGVTCEAALAPYGVDELALKSTNTAGTEQTNAHGMEGGYPGAGSQAAIVRGAERDGHLGATADIPPLPDFPGGRQLAAVEGRRDGGAGTTSSPSGRPAAAVSAIRSTGARRASPATSPRAWCRGPPRRPSTGWRSTGTENPTRTRPRGSGRRSGAPGGRPGAPRTRRRASSARPAPTPRTSSRFVIRWAAPGRGSRCAMAATAPTSCWSRPTAPSAADSRTCPRRRGPRPEFHDRETERWRSEASGLSGWARWAGRWRAIWPAPDSRSRAMTCAPKRWTPSRTPASPRPRVAPNSRRGRSSRSSASGSIRRSRRRCSARTAFSPAPGPAS